MRFVLPLTAIFMLCGTAAGAKVAPVAPPAVPLRIVIPIVEPKCETPPSTDGTIVVCGRKDERYRIDPTVLAAIRTRDSRGGPRPDAHAAMFHEGCSGIGLSPCAGQNVVPVSSILFVAVTALVKAAKGEDLRPMLHTVPDEYALYKQAKGTTEGQGAPGPK